MKHPSLRQHIKLWSVILIIIPSILIIGIYTGDRILLAKREKLESINQRVEYGKLIIEEWLMERARNVREMSRLDAFRELDLEQMQSILDLMNEKDEFDSFSFINRDGFFQLSTLSHGIRFKAASGQPYFENARQGREYISDLVIGRNSGLPIINFSSPVIDKEGQFQGVILGSIRVTTIENLLAKQRFGRTGEIYLLNQNGSYIVKPHYINLLVEKTAPETQAETGVQMGKDAFSQAVSGEEGATYWNDYLDVKVLGAYRRISDRGWILVGKISEAEILEPVYEQLFKMAVGVTALVGILLPIAALFTKRMLRPIDWLISQLSLVSSEQYALIGRDQYDGNLPYEFALLCDALANMSGKVEHSVTLLKEKLSEIRDVNTALENEIRQRQIIQKTLVELNQNLEHEVDVRTRNLKQNEQYYRTLVENSPDAIARYNRNGQVIFGNSAFINITGKAQEMLVGKRWPEQEQAYMEWAKHMEQVYQTGASVEFETDLPCTGESRCFAVRFILEPNQQSQEETILGIARDITEKKQLEAEFARFDRLDMVGEMAASIGHEVRNPMTTVRGYLQYYSNKDKFADYRDDFGIMIDEIDRANGIITDFLSLAKDKAISIKRGNLNDLILSVFPLMQADALCRGHDIELCLSPISDSEFDSKEMRQLILNLVRNSFEAIERCGRVKIRTYLLDTSVILEVQDNGPGIPAKVMEKLGTPFVTTKDNGTGLGLPVCYRIVARHNAKMSVMTSSQGTTFIVNFSLSNAQF